MFWNCTDLTRIQIPESVAKIGYAAFYGSGLEQVILPEKLQEIDDWAFAWLTNTREITIPDSVESIGMNAFIYAGRGHREHRQRREDHWPGRFLSVGK